ncbi:MAG: ISNCY family transposase [Burkholderiales bacterium]
MRLSVCPPPSFADLELQRQRLAVDEILQQLGTVLDQQAELIEMVRQDLVRGLRHPHTGRAGLTAEQTLRTYVLKLVKNWDLRELRDRTADGLTLRLFTHFFSAPVPRHKAFHRAFCRLRSETVRAINEIVVRWAVAQGLEDGKKLRGDTTVVETNIHFPTDSSLLWDGVRVITRLVGRLQALRPGLTTTPFANRTRSARRRMQEIQRLTPKQREDQQLPTYRALIKIATAVIRAGRQVATAAMAAPGPDLLTAVQVDALAKEILEYGARTERVVHQARRRVLQGEAVPTEDKIFSIFEPHTDLIKRGKVQRPVEFGHKVLLSESGHGLITDYRVLDGNPTDDRHVEPSLKHHIALFGVAPALSAYDRGFYSLDALKACQAAAVATECIPQRGGRKTPERAAYEKSRAFRRGQRFRAGIEGRISVLFRGRGMKRCLLHGRERFEIFVGLAVLANNLLVIADLLKRRAARRRRAA